MPTENERKYVMGMECEKQIAELSKKVLLIEQGYLISSRGVSLRLRQSNYKDGFLYTMTFKYTVNGGTSRVVEIEKNVDKRDFEDLWPYCLNKLEKIRYVVRDGNALWEVDFFKDHNKKNYFAMAEYEMPEGQIKPDVVPKFITENLLFEVPLTDSRFSSKLLGDVRYAINLYKSLKEKQK